MPTQPEIGPEQLLELASRRNPVARGEIALAVIDLCEREAAHAGPRSDVVLRLLGDLVRETTRDLRLRLAQRLAGADWAPRDIVAHLAHDDIDIAEVVIRRSKVLLDDDLIAVAREGGPNHRVAIARRPEISEDVTGVVAEFGEPEALVAMVANATSIISRATFEVCLEVAAEHDDLQRPLTQHPGLPADLVPNLYAIVGEELRRAIVARFEVDEEALGASLDVAANDALRASSAVSDADVEAASVVERLARGDRLTPSVVTQAAGNGQRALCEHAIARLAGMTVDELRLALRSGGLWAVVLACRAADVPDPAFTSICEALCVDQMAAYGADAASAAAVAKYTRADAMDALRELQQTP